MSGLGMALGGGLGLDSLNATLGSHPAFLGVVVAAFGIAVALGRLDGGQPYVPSRDELLDLAEKYDE